jgi:DNA segregation ATPase FtsK/SpoIIIE, S-DNA-T family
VKRGATVLPEAFLSTEPGFDYRLAAGVAFGGAFLLCVVALVAPGGAIGSPLQSFLGYAFGLGRFIVPVVLGAGAVTLVRDRFESTYQPSRLERLGWAGELLCLLVLLQLVDGNPAPRWDAGRGGGWLGQLLWSTLRQEFGPNGGGAIASTLALVALVLLLKISPARLRAVAVSVASLTALFLFHGAPSSARWLLRQVRPEPPLRWESPEQPVPRRPEPETAFRTGAEFVSPSQPRVVAPAAPGEPAWQLPPVTLLRMGTAGELSQTEMSRKIKLIEDTLADFDVFAKVVQVNPGPTITQFGLEPGFRERRDRNGAVVRREKIKVSEIVGLQNDLALALAAPSIRIEAPVPGRQVVGLEVPNSQTSLVSLRQVVESSAFQKLRLKSKLAIALGEDVSGQPVAADLAKMPHALIAGATGSGKSICINSIISCLLLQATPDEVRLILVDPKRVELSAYNEVPHLLRPVVVDADKVVSVLKWVVHEMDERYKLFEIHGVRNLEGFNKLAAAQPRKLPSADEPIDATSASPGLTPLPNIVVVIDELADLMMLAPDETERLICRLAQLSRATGIHLVVATQRPSVDVITGLIKANFPTRISFAVTSQIDSRTILDTPGAEKLLGKGDMLFMPPDAAKPIRLQGVFVSDEEIEEIVMHWRSLGPANYDEGLIKLPMPGDEAPEDSDDLYEKAAEVAREHTRISASLLQRRLRIGYNRAARLMDLLEETGVVGGSDGGGRSREVNHDPA